METDQVLSSTSDKMNKAVEFVQHEFDGIHTGKASPSMVENLNVQAYGSTVKLREVAAITTPDPRTISIQPWDKGISDEISKSIRAANIGLNPVVAGAVIRCPIPELSGDRRKELVKTTSGIAEEGRVRIRAARRDAMDALKKAQKGGEISEDDLKRHEKDVQHKTDDFIKKIGEHLANKEKELMAI